MGIIVWFRFVLPIFFYYFLLPIFLLALFFSLFPSFAFFCHNFIPLRVININNGYGTHVSVFASTSASCIQCENAMNGAVYTAIEWNK